MIPYFSRRKLLLILKSLVKVAIFFLVLLVVHPKLDKSTRINEVDKLRKSVLKENWDEFLEIVLNEVTFHEVDLITRVHNSLLEYDEAIAADEERIIPGLGEGGVEAHVPKEYEALANETMKNESFNRILSELISVTRSLPDPRNPALEEHYPFIT